MKNLKRAWLYVRRKKARSIWMFMIMFVMGLFVLVGLSVRSSARQAAEEVRKSIRTGIEVKLKAISGDELAETYTNEKGETVIVPKVSLLTKPKLEQLLSIEGIDGFFANKGSDKLYTGLKNHPGFYASVIQQYEENRLEDMDETEQKELVKSCEFSSRANAFYQIQDGRWHPFFTNGALELVEGRHIKLGDIGKAVISEELAEKNGLRIGDTIEAQNYDFITKEKYGDIYKSEVVGIFRINFEQKVSEYTTEQDLLSNIIFTDEEIGYWSQVEYNTHYMRDVLARNENIGNITFFVEDPLILDEVIERLLEVDTIDWSYYDLTDYDDDYRVAAGPLLSMVRLSTALIAVLVIGALVILSLILSMWIRSREREIGILLSVGVSKMAVVIQLLLECCLIALAAFCLAGLLAKPVTNRVGDALAKAVSPSENTGDYEVKGQEGTWDVVVNKLPKEQIILEYDIAPQTEALVLLAMLLVAVISVAVSSMRIISQNPGEILRNG